MNLLMLAGIFTVVIGLASFVDDSMPELQFVLWPGLIVLAICLAYYALHGILGLRFATTDENASNYSSGIRKSAS